MKRLSVLVAIVSVALAAWPALAAAATYRGVVVSKQSGVLLVATSAGVVHGIRGSSTAHVGSRVAVSGTRVSIVGRASRVRVQGVLVRKTSHTLFLSAGHRLLAVHSSRALASAAGNNPGTLQPGELVQTTVTIDDQGELEDDDTQGLGTTSSTQITATITDVAPGSISVTATGSTSPLTIPLPAGLTLPSTLVGQQITLTLDFSGGQTQAEPGDEQGNNSQGDD